MSKANRSQETGGRPLTANNVVVKIGSNILTGADGPVRSRFEAIGSAVLKLKTLIPSVTIVSSGAIASGYKLLGFKTRPKNITDKQAAAAVGQARLMQFYERALENIPVAQILITKADFGNRERYLNAKSTIARLHKLGAVPIINENDALIANELKYVESFGDNDNLSALVAGLIEADALLILSDVDGLYSADPSKDKNARLIPQVDEITEEILTMAGESVSGVGTGGMASKLRSAKIAQESGCAVGIVNGGNPENILRFFRGEGVGTFFPATPRKSAAKKRWIANCAIPMGEIIVNKGAFQAVLAHSSLLASGVVAVSGLFEAGSIVKLVTEDLTVFAVARVRHDSATIDKIKSLRSFEIEQLLGMKEPIVAHCDEIVGGLP